MSADTKTDAQEVDIDELEVEIFVIAKSEKKLSSAVSFLSRRGWPTTIFTNVTKAVEAIAEKRPDFVLISLNHPSPSVAKLPDVISQAFNLTCVGFIESMDGASTARLNQSKMPNKLNGQPSGPSIHRAIRKILAARFNVHEERAIEKSKKSEGNENQKVTIKGSSGADADGNVRTKSSGAMSGNTHVISGEGMGDEHMAAMSGSSSSSYGAMALSSSQGEGGANNDGDGSAALSSSSGSASGFSSGRGLSGGQHSTNATSVGEIQSGSGFENMETVESEKYKMGKKKRMSLKDLASANSTNAGASADGTQAKDPNAPGTIGAAAGIEAAKKELGLGANSPEGSATAAADVVGNLKKSLFGETGEESPELDLEKDKQARIEGLGAGGFKKAVETAIGRVCKSVQDATTEPLMEIRHVGVIPVESEKFPGYLVVVWQYPEMNARESFLRACEKELVSAVATMQLEAKLESGFWVSLLETEFDEWVQDSALFDFKLVHQKREVGVAFFPTDGPLRKTTHFPDRQMLAVGVDSISPEQPVNFMAYLHLKKNQKYYLYLRKGRHLQEKQKERLIDRNIKDLLAKPEDFENLRQYFATVFLNSTIQNLKPAA